MKLLPLPFRRFPMVSLIRMLAARFFRSRYSACLLGGSKTASFWSVVAGEACHGDGWTADALSLKPRTGLAKRNDLPCRLNSIICNASCSHICKYKVIQFHTPVRHPAGEINMPKSMIFTPFACHPQNIMLSSLRSIWAIRPCA